MKIELRIEALSPLHLGSGQADVLLDAEVVHDLYGQPYFPAKRFKGLLYESAKEVWEMSSYSGRELFSMEELDALFQRRQESGVQLIVHNFYLPDYEARCAAWRYMEEKYAALIRKEDVLEEYTSIRYQTRLDAKTGTAADTSLHNLRVVDGGIRFYGSVEIVDGTQRQRQILALACRNLQYAGGKRNRGCGKIRVAFKGMDLDIKQAVQ